MSRETAPDPALLVIFEAEVRETVATMRGNLLGIECGQEASALLEDTLRLAHDLKGSARVVGYPAVGSLAHSLESRLIRWRTAAPERAEIDAALRATDLLERLALRPEDSPAQAEAARLVEQLEAAPAPAPARRPPTLTAEPRRSRPVRQARPESIRVARGDVDAVANGLSEMLVHAQAADTGMRRFDKSLRALHALRIPRDDRGLASLHAAFSDSLLDLRGAASSLRETLRRLDASLRDADLGARKLCLVPAFDLLVHLERVARDAAASLGRSLRIEIEGRDLWVDMELAEALKGPLTHAVRNAVDHGLEAPDERRSRGKPEAGQLRIAIVEERDQLEVVVADDGRGIDMPAVRRKLGRLADGLPDAAVLSALLRSGMSTRDRVTDLSGRGLGLGALAVTADRLRGEVLLESTEGQGTRLTIDLPLRLSLLQGLVVQAGPSLFVLPLGGLLEVQGPEPRAVPLARLLGLPEGAAAPDEARSVRLRSRDGEVVLGVDRVVTGASDRMEVVRRPVGAHLGRVPFVEGATILPTGDPALILDPRELTEACRRQLSAAASPNDARRRILLADDSATLRATLQRDLCKAGFDVVLAENGQEALDRLAAFPCHAVVSDVQMPVRGGFELLAACEGRLPVILVTAYPDAEDERRALALGAEAYLTKDERLGDRVVASLRSALSVTRNPSP